MSPFAHLAGGRALRRLALLSLAASVFVVAGCSLSRPAPVKRTFLLDPPAPAAVATAKPQTLRIGTFNTAAPYRDRAFVYRTEPLKYESDFYNEFFVPPGPMIAEATARALIAANVFARVVPPGTAPEDGDYLLEAFISDLYADTRPAKPEAEIAVTFYVSRTAYPQAVLWSREYRQRATLTANTPDALAQAWNSALGTILAEFTRDLSAADLRKP